MMTTKWLCQHDLLLICCLFQNKKEILMKSRSYVCLAYLPPTATHVVQFAYSFDDGNFTKNFLFRKINAWNHFGFQQIFYEWWKKYIFRSIFRINWNLQKLTYVLVPIIFWKISFCSRKLTGISWCIIYF